MEVAPSVIQKSLLFTLCRPCVLVFQPFVVCFWFLAVDASVHCHQLSFNGIILATELHLERRASCFPFLLTTFAEPLSDGGGVG